MLDGGTESSPRRSSREQDRLGELVERGPLPDPVEGRTSEDLVALQLARPHGAGASKDGTSKLVGLSAPAQRSHPEVRSFGWLRR